MFIKYENYCKVNNTINEMNVQLIKPIERQRGSTRKNALLKNVVKLILISFPPMKWTISLKTCLQNVTLLHLQEELQAALRLLTLSATTMTFTVGNWSCKPSSSESQAENGLLGQLILGFLSFPPGCNHEFSDVNLSRQYL